MTRSAPAFQFYAEDFFCGVVDMTDEECGIYIKLLAVCWSKDGVTEAMIRTVTTNSEAALSILKAKFELHDDGRFRHKRLVEQRDLHEKRKTAGSKGGSKTQANGQAKGVAKQGSPFPSPTPSPSPITKKKTASGRSPSLEEVREYCQERGSRIDPEQFVDFYSANGWKQKGGNPVKDWKAAVRTWERNNFSSGKSGNNNIGI